MRSYSLQGWEQVAYILDKLTTNLSRMNQETKTKELPLSLYFESIDMPIINIIEYLARIRSFAECSNSCIIIAFIYIDRVLQKNPTFGLNARKIHRLVLTAMILAIKYLDDSYTNNKTYSFLGGIPVDELNELELVFISLLQFDLYVHPEIYYKYNHEIVLQYQKLRERESKHTMMTDCMEFKKKEDKESRENSRV